jgi:hypothetical protein
MKIITIIHNFIWSKPVPFDHQNRNTSHGRSIEKLLVELSLYGRTKLLQMDTGWWCFIEATDATAGARLVIGSEINHTHPSDAIAECFHSVEGSGFLKQALSSAIPPKRLRR